MTRRFSFLQQVRNLRDETSGNAMMIVGLGIFALTAATGTAIDMGRAQLVQAKLSSSLDAAGLAAGATANSQDITTQATKYFNANYPTGYLGSTITSFTVTPSEDNNTITLNAVADVQNSFMRAVGIPSLTVTASSEITRANKGMELVLVLDNTGSMSETAGSGVTKIEALKSASNDLIDILYGGNSTIDNVWIGIVPFSQAVNIGNTRSSWVSGSFTWGTTSWMGCVDARETSGRDITDDTPSTASFPQYYWPCDTNNRWYGTNSSRNNCSTSGTVRYKSGLGSSLGPNKGCAEELLAMTSNKSTILAKISAMKADGNTHIPLGLAWGWRMLSPKWRDLWGGEMDTEDLPLDYNTPLMNKVVVLMTDGDNTMSDSVRGAYWYPANGKLGTTSASAAADELDDRTAEICENMKSQNIIIYTIALGTGLSTASQDMLRNCATKDAYYFYSPTTSALQQAFHTIGDSLANLRISH